LCGAVKYSIDCEPIVVGHCHCTMCQKQHGAAFATYVSVERENFQYLNGENNLTSYNSSSSIFRKFCSTCGSNIEWCGSPEYPNWVSITLATFTTELEPSNIENYNVETKCKWL
jgi:hypothetical protein